MKAAHSKPATGKRVITNGKKGTIAFLGETEFSTGEWIGIVVREGERGQPQGETSEWGEVWEGRTPGGTGRARERMIAFVRGAPPLSFSPV